MITLYYTIHYTLVKCMIKMLKYFYTIYVCRIFDFQFCKKQIKIKDRLIGLLLLLYSETYI